MVFLIPQLVGTPEYDPTPALPEQGAVLNHNDFLGLHMLAASTSLKAAGYGIPMDSPAHRVTLVGSNDRSCTYKVLDVRECKANGRDILTPAQEDALDYVRYPDDQPQPDVISFPARGSR